MKPLKIPKSKKWKGLKVYCQKCRATVDETCKESGKNLENCRFGEKHRFQVVVHVPGTKNARKMKILKTRDFNVAISQAIEFKKETFEEINTSGKLRIEKISDSLYLRDIYEWYEKWLRNEDTNSLSGRIRSKDYINNVKKCFDYSKEAWAESFNEMTVHDINSARIKKLYSLFEKLNLSPRTINKFCSYFRTLLERVSLEKDIAIRNHFKRFKQLPQATEPRAITKKEYEGILQYINDPNSIKSEFTGNKMRFHGHEYMSSAIQLGLHGGCRRTELINLKFNCEFEEEGFSFFKIENFKVNNIQNRKDEKSKKYIIIPVTTGLRNVLNEIGYEKFKGSDRFIIAPELTGKRGRWLEDNISRAFSFFYRRINPNERLGFGSLRKAYISGLVKYYGKDARGVSQHSNDSVIEKHYLDKKVLLKAASEYDPFGEQVEKQKQIEEIRESKKVEPTNLIR